MTALPVSPHYLVAESETPDERDARRAHVGKSAGETYAATLRQMSPGCRVTIVAPADDDARKFEPHELRSFDAVFLTGSPLHVYDDSPEVRREIAFMRAVFASGMPSFGSCAGLQVAVAAAGGTVRKMADRMEAGISRRISATAAGRGHPLLAGRPASWDAPAIHGDEVEMLPPGATLLATNSVTRVQAVEIRHDGGIFWGVQYHPELAIGEIAAALRRQAADLVAAGLAETSDDVGTRADQLDRLHRAPGHRLHRWMLGVDGEFAEEDRRRMAASTTGLSRVRKACCSQHRTYRPAGAIAAAFAARTLGDSRQPSSASGRDAVIAGERLRQLAAPQPSQQRPRAHCLPGTVDAANPP